MSAHPNVDPQSDPAISNHHAQRKYPPQIPTTELAILSRQSQEQEWVAAFIDGQFYLADPRSIGKLKQIENEIEQEKNKLIRFQMENLSFNNSFLSAKQAGEPNASFQSNSPTVFDPNHQIEQLDRVKQELEKEEDRYRQNIKDMERQKQQLTSNMKKLQTNKPAQNIVIKEAAKSREQIQKSVSNVGNKANELIQNKPNEKSQIVNPNLLKEEAKSNRYQAEQVPAQQNNNKNSKLDKSIQWSQISHTSPQNQEPKLTEPNSEIYLKKQQSAPAMANSDPLAENNKTNESPKLRKLNSGFIYSINDRKMKTFMIHSLPKRDRPTASKQLDQSVKNEPDPIKPPSPQNQPQSNEEVSKEEINKMQLIIQQLQQKLKAIEKRQNNQIPLDPKQSISPPLKQPSKDSLPRITPIQEFSPKQQEINRKNDFKLRQHSSPFKLKLESSILQINMLEDKRREEQSYYNEKNRLSQQIDRLKNIVRGLQIEKIKSNDEPIKGNHQQRPFNQRSISLSRFQEEQQQHSIQNHNRKAFQSNSRVKDAGKIIHIINSPINLKPKAFAGNNQQSDAIFSPPYKAGKKHPSHRFIQSSQVIQSSQISKTPLRAGRYLAKDSRREADQLDNPEEDIEQLLIHARDLEIPALPPTPNVRMAQEELLSLAKQIYSIMRVQIQENQQITVKKYKNCMFFSINNHAYHNVLWHFSGKFYMGGWKINNSGEGQKDGEGLQISPLKHIYKGQFLNGKKNGTGIMKLQNGSLYDGQWAEGNKSGRGIYFDAAARSIYNGQWKNNKKQGKGLLKISQKEHYEGTFVQSIKEGYGEETFPNGDKYKGEYINGKFHGKGKYSWANGSSYQGEFFEGVRQGQGCWKSASKNPDIYIGAYKRDKKNGYGRYIWANGCIYEGEFVNDVKHGNGRITYQDGKQTKGTWKEGNLVTNQQDRQAQHQERPLQKTSRMIPVNFVAPKRTSKN